MSLVVFQHHPDETVSRLGTILQAHGHRLRTVALYDDQPVPVDLDDVDGLVSMGGPMNVSEADQHPWILEEMDLIRAAHKAELPIVGICLGAQLIAVALGGEVEAMKEPEVGFGNVKLGFPGTIDPVMSGIIWNCPQFHLHAQQVTELPPGAVPLAGSVQSTIQSFKVGLTTYGFQYHFEWERAEIDRFSRDELAIRAGLTMASAMQQTEQHIDLYRHMGDRLCDNITMLLFPIDKPMTAK